MNWENVYIEVLTVQGTAASMTNAATPIIIEVLNADMLGGLPPVFLEVGIPGPPGPPGPDGDADMPYARRTDFATDTVIYKGEAQVGATDVQPVWRIRRLSIGVDGDVTEEWAAGSSAFDKVWADRATLSYS